MYQVGEVKRGKQIGKGNNSHNFIWQACDMCGKERWVPLDKDIPRFHHCLKCNMGELGENSNGWKGGRVINNMGYVDIRLQPDDFFYPMVRASGYVLEHRLVVAKRLGRCLHSWEMVHHKDHVKGNNDDSNLQLVSDDRHKQITILENKIDRQTLMLNELSKEIRLLRWELKECNRTRELNYDL